MKNTHTSLRNTSPTQLPQKNTTMKNKYQLKKPQLLLKLFLNKLKKKEQNSLRMENGHNQMRLFTKRQLLKLKKLLRLKLKL